MGEERRQMSSRWIIGIVVAKNEISVSAVMVAVFDDAESWLSDQKLFYVQLRPVSKKHIPFDESGGWVSLLIGKRCGHHKRRLIHNRLQ